MTTIEIIALCVGALGLVTIAILATTIPAIRNWAIFKSKEAATEILRAHLLRRVRTIAEKEYPKIASDVLSGKLTSAQQVKDRLHALGKDLYSETIRDMGNEVQRLGPDTGSALRGLLEWAVDYESPFPGQETAKRLLASDTAKAVVDKGIYFITNHNANEGPVTVIHADVDGASP